MNKTKLKNIEWSVLVIAILLTIIGLIALVSATYDTNHEELIKQLMWFGISLVVMFAIIYLDYEWISNLWIPIYIVTILILIVVLFTKPINGARSWFNFGFFSIQPGEFAKIFITICLAKIISIFRKKDLNLGINNIKYLILTIVFFALPVGLILIQPDIGTAITFFVLLAIMLFTSGIKVKYIIIALLIVAIAIPILYFFVLPPHAVNRIKVFLDPSLDPRGIGYNVIQSKLAIGSGGLFGMGLFKGNQTQLRVFIP